MDLVPTFSGEQLSRAQRYRDSCFQAVFEGYIAIFSMLVKYNAACPVVTCEHPATFDFV